MKEWESTQSRKLASRECGLRGIWSEIALIQRVRPEIDYLKAEHNTVENFPSGTEQKLR